MEFSKTLKEELEGRIKRLEDFIESKGLGSSRLNKAKSIQRNVNLAVFLGSIITVAGVVYLVMNKNHD